MSGVGRVGTLRWPGRCINQECHSIKKGYPIFGAWCIARVDIGELSKNREQDLKKVEKFANMIVPEGYVWHHHEDGKTMMLVPEDIHVATGHDGGHAGNE